MTCADRSVSAAIGVVRTVAARMTRVVCFHINKSVACRPQVVPLSALCYRSVWFRGAALGLLFRLIYPVDRFVDCALRFFSPPHAISRHDSLFGVLLIVWSLQSTLMYRQCFE